MCTEFICISSRQIFWICHFGAIFQVPKSFLGTMGTIIIRMGTKVNIKLISFRIQLSRLENPKIHRTFLVRTISGDDVIATDKTSTAFTAMQWYDIKQREWDSLNSFLQAFQKYYFWLPFQKSFHFQSDQTTVTSGNSRFPLTFFRNKLGFSY